jgi:hypothetical protein
MKRISVKISFISSLQSATLTSFAQNFTFKMLKVILLSLTPMLLLSCNNKLSFSYIEGSGKIVTEKREVNNYSSIDLRMAGNVKISADNRFKLLVSADDNIIREINTFVRNGTLIISGNKNFRNATIDIIISLPSAEKISVNSSGEIMIGDPFPCKEINFNIGGSGNITAKVESEEIHSTIAGSGSLNLSGKAHLHRMEILGSGAINAYELNTSASHVKVNGSGSSFISVEDNLEVRTNGSGNVYYRGAPGIDSVMKGSGKIINTD